MRIDTPKDTPTHLLENPDQWITKVGKFLRRTSLDEIPQIINIFKGEMSIIGPRPALWNQYDLIEERDKYGANDVPVGLTGWAQINGRDELGIDVKARLDGEYAERIGLLMDVRCFFGTVISVLRTEGVVEGGTGVKGKADNNKAEETVTK
jgi:O-antigen biosynthesis protein WbqP